MDATGNPDIVVAAVERERRCIASVLHEKLCQTLAGISIQLEVMARRVRENEPLDPSHFSELSQHVHDAIEQARGVAGDLRSANLKGAGLMESLDKLAETTTKEIPCEYVCEKPVFVADAWMALALFRIAEEAVSNALKHAKASRITINLIRTDSRVVLKVRDDGQGLIVGQNSEVASGIGIMRRRARSIGAKLEISSRRAYGTTITCTCNVPSEGAATAGLTVK